MQSIQFWSQLLIPNVLIKFSSLALVDQMSLMFCMHMDSGILCVSIFRPFLLHKCKINIENTLE